MSEYAKKLDTLESLQQKIEIKKSLMIDKALKSNSPSDIMQAQKRLQNIQNRDKSDKKSLILDPLDFNSSFGYKDKPFSMSYQMLKNMAKVPIINSIIKTRKNQIADFAEPQTDRYSTGFQIKKKVKLGQPEAENTPEDWRKIEEIQNFILNCGRNNSWENDDFDTFIRKFVDDSLTYDQATFEVVDDHQGLPYEFFATDSSTFRISDSYDDDEEYDKQQAERIKGYLPSYVQIYQNNVVNEYYPWELCFGIRNPSTSIFNTGYGMSELEELVTIVTSMLWADDYNKRFFSQGSAPKGILRLKDMDANSKQLKAFRQEWNSMISGVQQSWKTPVVSGDVEFIDLQKNNRDMEYSAWGEYLIKIACSVYSIDPNEIGFSINGSSGGGSSLFESNNEQRLKHSKDKGLYPLLKFIQRKINKYIVSRLDPEFEFQFVGLNGMTPTEELELDIKKSTSLYTINEVRKARGDDEIEGGDLIMNPTFTQSKMMEAQNAAQAEMNAGGEEEENPFLQGLEDLDFDDEENPFLKSFKNTLNKSKK